MRNKIVAGNWKMHKTVEESLALCTEIRGMLRDEYHGKSEIILIPPFTSLNAVSRLLEGTVLALGAQNCHEELNGAFTGEISAPMLRSAGCAFVVIGHSERRHYYNENNALLARKVKTAIKAGLKVIYCCGETIEQRENKSFFQVVESQIREGLFELDRKEFQEVIIAYEPVWAIGTGMTATPETANEMHQFIRKVVAGFYSEELAAELRILYGGSVKADNAAQLFGKSDIDGGLIGGASLKSRDFLEIIKAAR